MTKKVKWLLNEAIRLVGREFRLSQAHLRELKSGKENMARHMAFSLAGEVLGLPPSDVFKKYLKHIPGLKKVHWRLRRELQKKLVDFDV